MSSFRSPDDLTYAGLLDKYHALCEECSELAHALEQREMDILVLESEIQELEELLYQNGIWKRLDLG